MGLGAIMTAGLGGAGRVIAIDLDDNRLATAKELGATDTVNAGDPDLVQKVKDLTDGLGVEVAVEAVGIPQTFETCLAITRPHGTVANAGVHGKPVELPLTELWISSIAITTGLVDGYSIERLLKMVQSSKLEAKKMATHRFMMDQFMEAYDLFSNAAEHNAVKLVITRD